MKLICYIFIIALTVFNVSCSSKRNLDYVNSNNGRILSVNSPLNNTNISKKFILANIDKISAQKISPPGFKRTKK